MNTRILMKLMSALLALVLIAAACGSDEADEGADDGTATTEAMDDAEAGEGPGAGVEVTMARADWSTGYFQAELYKNLMEQLGYTVSEPSALELGPSLAYLAMAEGDADFWANSWYPGHFSWLEAELPDGTKVGDHVSVVGEEMLASGLQGYLITKSVADEYGITHLDQLNDDPEITALFDSDGNGKANIFGCQESYTCDDIITEQICQSGWENVEQTIAGYDAMVAEAEALVNAGDPMVIYTWTPSAYITKLIPGDNVVWLAVEDVVDDSNCSGVDGGEEYAQPNATANIPADQCPGTDENGVCQLGWTAADIQVTANNDFLEANPAAKALFEQVRLSVIDVSLVNVEQDGGCDTTECIAGLAQTWIDDNADTVNGWLDAARAAA